MRTYDPRSVNVFVDGDRMVGFGEGTFVSVSKDAENYNEHVGAHGDVTRSRNPNQLGSISITLKQSSPSNRKLLNLAKSQRLFRAYVVDDNDGGIAVGGTQCWVQQPSDADWSNEEQERDWTIRVADYSMEG